MGNHQHPSIRLAQRIHAVGNDLQRVDIETAVGFV